MQIRTNIRFLVARTFISGLSFNHLQTLNDHLDDLRDSHPGRWSVAQTAQEHPISG
jgi:hypothetical protein